MRFFVVSIVVTVSVKGQGPIYVYIYIYIDNIYVINVYKCKSMIFYVMIEYHVGKGPELYARLTP